MLEFLLGQYCSLDDEDIVEDGYSFIDVEQVKPNVMYNIKLDIDWEDITFYDVDLDM